MRYPINKLQLRMSRPLLEPEKRDNTVDIDGQKGFFGTTQRR